ncbi:MAG: METTL5 family protein [Thermoplasmata archaeon]
MKKKALEMALQRISPHPEPKPHLEQYNTPAKIAADVLFLAYSLGDIECKKVVDLGCGTGIFAIGAKLLYAKEVIGIDIDEKAIVIARENAKKFHATVDFRTCEIKDFNEECDTVLQNPPFGAQRRHADRLFLRTALALSSVVYSIHLANTQRFIEKEAERLQAKVTHRKRYEFEIRYTFRFHSKEKKNFDVMMFRMERIGGMI